MKTILFITALLFAGCVSDPHSPHHPIPWHAPHPPFPPHVDPRPPFHPPHFRAENKVHAKGLKLSKFRLLMPRATAPLVEAIPDSLDLRGKISPVLDQGECGDCYAFGTTSALTDALMLQGLSKGTLSPQYFADYSGNQCNGGWFDVMKYGVAPKGVPTISNYALTNVNENPMPLKGPLGSSLSWSMLGQESGVTPRDIEAYMTKYGFPVPVDMAAGAGNFDSPYGGYSSGVYLNCVANAPVDHLVEIVGWSNEGSKFNDSGFLSAGKGYWIVRNSWGSSWGESGFFRIAMTDAKGNKCSSFAQDAAVFFYPKSSTQSCNGNIFCEVWQFITGIF